MKNVFFKPWVGPNYNSGFNGKRILVIGTSHYCNSKDEKCTECPKSCGNYNIKNLTIEVINDDARSNASSKYKKTFTCFERAMVNREFKSLPERESFWDSLSFYNFCQMPLSYWNDKATNSQLVDSLSAFKEVLTTLKPEVIIIWGAPVRKIILSQLDCELLNNINEENIYSLNYSSTDKAVLCPIHHPSIGFSWQKWHPFIDKAINININNCED